MKASIDKVTWYNLLKKEDEDMDMSFGENLQFYRRKNNITQEQLAERLEVSRQSVSKWESNTTYPEMDKLLLLCKMFSCTLDTLLRGDAESACVEDTEDYDRHMNHFNRAITAGVGMLLLGVAVMLALQSIGISSTIAVMALMIFVIASIMTFITAGLGHDTFTKKHPNIKPFYAAELIEKFDKRFAVMMSASIGLMLASVLWMVGSSALPLPAGCTRSLYVAIFMVLLAVSISGMTYAGMQKDKYDIEKYNLANSTEAKAKAKASEENPVVGKICGSIFMLALTAYLIMGFVWNMWSTGWVVFPVWIALCAISALVFAKSGKH